MHDVSVTSLEERVLAHSQKRKRKTTVADGQPNELQKKRLCEFVDSSLNPLSHTVGAWPSQTQWVELALEPLFRDSTSVWCQRSTFKQIQSALEKLCTIAAEDRHDHVSREETWWQRHRNNLINHRRPWKWSDGSKDYFVAIREGCSKLLSPVSAIKSITKRRRLDEYKAHEGDDNYTDGLMTCPRCRHRSIIINTSTCMYGECDKECKAAAALKKITKKAAARPEAIKLVCTGNSDTRGCGCVVFALPGKLWY